jgi:peptidoglycan hydrolase-like protein with peptidoglycan-binding domain
MAASMFTLGDIYEQGDAAPKDLAAALGWFAITEEFERQVNHGGESTLEKTAAQRAQSLKRTLTPAELQRAEELGQSEFHEIVLALSTARRPAGRAEPAETPPAPAETASAPAAPVVNDDASGWPRDTAGQIRAIQQLLVELKLLRDKPDGMFGPNTRSAVRDFQRSVGLNPSGEPNKEVYAALKAKRVAQVTAKGWSLPPPQSAAKANEMPPASTDSAKSEPASPAAIAAETGREAPPAEPAKVEAPAAPAIEIPKAEPPSAPTSADVAATPALTAPAAPAADAAPPRPARSADPPPPPPLRVDVSKPPAVAAPAAPEKPRVASVEPTKGAAPGDAWPNNAIDQTKAIQVMLQELRFYHGTATGRVDPATRTAIRDYQRLAGLKETGETSKALFDSLKEMRAMMAPKRD